jgi:outer membrane immunogenic protein
VVGATCANNVFCSTGSTTSVRSGWTVGAGVEHMFLQHLTGKIEYLYYNLGSTNYVAAEASAAAGAALGAPNVDVRTSLTGQIVRAGLNYKF